MRMRRIRISAADYDAALGQMAPVGSPHDGASNAGMAEPCSGARLLEADISIGIERSHQHPENSRPRRPGFRMVQPTATRLFDSSREADCGTATWISHGAFQPMGVDTIE